ncbi:MAG: hypothetical protein KAW40_01910 [Candidatus Aenigmarchaeota archaeon]|nr:hypothetical protein [Candidatus Aenigmarchaeota archaeon]
MIKNSNLRKFLLSFVVFFAVLALPVLGFPASLKSDGELLYVAHKDGTLEVWNKSSGSLIERFLTNIKLWSFEMDGTNFYVGSEDGRVLVLDLDGQILEEINASPASMVSSIAIDEDSKFLYAGSHDNVIRIWDTQDWSLVKVIEEHKLPVNALVLDGRYLYSASGDGSVKVWDKHTMVLVKNLTTHTEWRTARNEGYVVWKMVVHGNKVYTGHVNGKIRIWDLNTDSLVKEVEAHTGDVGALVTDGQYIFSSRYMEKSVKIWTMDGEPAGSVLHMEYSPQELEVDNNYLYAGVREGGVVVYDKNYRNLVMELGSFAEAMPQSPERELGSSEFNPVLPVVVFFALFLVIVVTLETYVSVKKEYGRLTKSGVKNFLTSFVKIEDALKILGVASIIIFVLGLLNARSVFPSYVYGLQAIYYFDVLVRKGAFLPIWFLLLPSLAYWATKKHKRRIRYLTSVIALFIAVIVYLVAPTVT